MSGKISTLNNIQVLHFQVLFCVRYSAANDVVIFELGMNWWLQEVQKRLKMPCINT